MAMLECPDTFTLPFVPDDWIAVAVNPSLYELQPPDKRAAVHISIYRRPESALSPGGAEGFLERFVSATKPEGQVHTIRVPPTPREQRVFAKYQARADAGVVFEWFAACILWPTAMLIGSCNATPGDPILGTAVTMIASIFEGTTA